MNGQDRLLEGDFSEARTEEDLNAPIEWRGLPEFRAVTRDVRLVLSFDTEAERDQLVAQLGVTISKKTGPTWSAWWPPRDREDLASLRFDFGEDGSASLPEVEESFEVTSSTAADDVEAWREHVGHMVAIERAHDGALVGARCSTCDVDLPDPDLVTELSPEPEPAGDAPGAEPADAPEAAATAAHGAETEQEPRTDRERFGAYPGQEPYSR